LIKLNPETKKTLTQELVKALAGMSIINGNIGFEAWQALAATGAVLPKDHKPKANGDPGRQVRTRLNAIISDDPVRDFAFDYLLEVVPGILGLTDASGPLAETLGTDPKTLANELIDALEELPYPYAFSIALPEQLSFLLPQSDAELKIGARVRLTRADHAFKQRYPIVFVGSRNESKLPVASLGFPTINSGTVMLQIEADGFVDSYGTSTTVQDGMLAIKAFFGFCIANGVLDRGFAWSPKSEVVQMLFHRRDLAEYVGHKEFEPDASYFMQNLRMAPARPSADQIQEKLQRIGLWLDESVPLQRLQLASRWFFDSSATRDDITGFVQAVIVLETLLGDTEASDRNAISLGELLRNRCAYLLGKSAKERESIMKQFKAIYEIRSAIVHRGHHRLTTHEMVLLHMLRSFCARVIRAEGNLLTSTA